MRHFNLLLASVLFFPLLFAACDDDPAIATTDASALLTNGSFKSWYLVTQTSQTTFCSATTPQGADNQFIFYADGTFAFDHGQVVQDPDCTGDNCCSDPADMEGTWKFTNDGSGIEVFAIDLNQVIFKTTIDLLEEHKLVLNDAEASLVFKPFVQADEPCLPNTRCPSI